MNPDLLDIVRYFLSHLSLILSLVVNDEIVIQCIRCLLVLDFNVKNLIQYGSAKN